MKELPFYEKGKYQIFRKKKKQIVAGSPALEHSPESSHSMRSNSLFIKKDKRKDKRKGSIDKRKSR